MKPIHRDTRGEMQAGHWAAIIVSVAFVLILGYVLIAPLSAQSYVASNNASTGNASRNSLAGANKALLPLGPLMFILSVVICAVVAILYVLKEMSGG